MTDEKKKQAQKVAKGCGLGCLAVVVVVFVFMAISIVLAPPGEKVVAKPKKPTPTPIVLSGTLRADALSLAVTNGDSFAWKGMAIQINPGFFNGGYSFKTGDILHPGETKTVPLLQFTDSDNKRFKSIDTKISEVRIRALTTEGVAFGFWIFE